METKNIDINIQAAIPASRGIGSMVGSLVGQAYHKVESRNTWQGGDQGWDNDNDKIRQGLSTMLIPNRPIKKYMLKDVDIFNACYYSRGAGDSKEVGIAINLHEDGTFDQFFPLNRDIFKLVKSTPDAINDALKGQGDNFFLNPSAVARVINDANRVEVSAVDNLIKALNSIKQNLVTAINENTKKAEKFAKELQETKVETVDFRDILKGEVGAMVEVSTTKGAE
jgi:hypothetical protein